MSSSFNGIRIKKQNTMPYTSPSTESTLWINNTDGLLYLDSLAVGVTGISQSFFGVTGGADLTAWTQTDQTGSYASTKQLSFDSTSLQTGATGSQVTLTLADTITKNLTFNPVSNNVHLTQGIIMSDLYTNCGLRFESTATNGDLYSSNFQARPPAYTEGVILNIGSAESGVSKNLFKVTCQPATKNIILGDNETSGNFVQVDADGNLGFKYGNAQNLAVSSSGQVTFGDPSSVTTSGLTVSNAGSITAYHQSNLAYMINPDASFSFGSAGGYQVGISLDGNVFNMGSNVGGRRARMNFNNGHFEFINNAGNVTAYIDCETGSSSFGLGQNSTMVFNSTIANTGDIFTVTNNTISRVNKISSQLINGVYEVVQDVNVYLGRNVFIESNGLIQGGQNLYDWIKAQFGL